MNEAKGDSEQPRTGQSPGVGALQSLAHWSRVPAAFGWLSLTPRGQWLIKGKPVTNGRLTAFINRQYRADEKGRWYFQNGAQRVFVTLQGLPLCFDLEVSAVHGQVALVAHTGRRVSRISAAYLTDSGELALQTDLGPGLLDDRAFVRVDELLRPCAGGDDLEQALLDLSQGRGAGVELALPVGHGVRLRAVSRESLARHLGYVSDPEQV